MRVSAILIAFFALVFAPLGAAQVVDTSRPLEELKEQAAGKSATALEFQANNVRDQIQKVLEDIADLEEKLAGLPEEEQPAVQEEIDTHKARIVDEMAPAMDVFVDALGEKGGEVADHQQFLMNATGDLTYGGAAAALGLAQQWIGRAKDWLVEEGPGYLVKLLLFLAMMLVAKIVANILAGIVRRALSTSKIKVSALLRDFTVNTTRRIVLFLGFLIALASVGISIGPFLAAFGAVGLVVGFALSETLNNFAAGVMILLYRPYDVGDFVNAGGEMGKVDAMNLVSTTLITPDNQVKIIPNGSIWGGVITNVTANPTRRVDFTFGIGYEDDIDKAEKVLAEVVAAHELILDDPEPAIKLHELADSSVNFVVRVWTKTGDYWTVFWDITKAVKQRFDAEGLSIPYPQQDVHVHQVSGAE